MKTVLVIDDEKPTLSMFSLLLEGMGYTVFTADSGQSGLEAFARIRPAIVFTDIKMPDLDGLDVLARIKAMDAQAEVIVVTGHGDVELALNSLSLDAADFIDKPIRSPALARALARAEERLAARGRGRERVEVANLPEATVIGIGGRLSSASEAAMEQAGAQAVERGLPVVVSLDASAPVTGAGVALLTLLKGQCAEAGTAFAVACGGTDQRDMLSGSGVFGPTDIHDNEKAALAAVVAGSRSPARTI
ncbi:MAG: response regulator [Desulfovibrionaceae bacterium]